MEQRLNIAKPHLRLSKKVRLFLFIDNVIILRASSTNLHVSFSGKS